MPPGSGKTRKRAFLYLLFAKKVAGRGFVIFFTETLGGRKHNKNYLNEGGI
jgi:hypothetical protein